MIVNYLMYSIHYSPKIGKRDTIPQHDLFAGITQIRKAGDKHILRFLTLSDMQTQHGLF